MKRALIVVGLAAVAVTSPAFAVTGNKLFEWCDSAAQGDQTACNAYIIGVAEGVMQATSFVQEIGGYAPLRYCPPEGYTHVQTRDIVIAGLRERPESRQMGAAMLIMVALTAAWPCPDD
jgi:hypothetical protein